MISPQRAALLLALAMLLTSPLSIADEPTAAGLAHCAGIASDSARLSCYDALAGRSSAALKPALAGSAAAPVAAAPSVAPAAAAAPAIAAAPAPAPAAMPTTAPAAVAAKSAAVIEPVAAPDPAAATANFGLSATQQKRVPQEPNSIEAQVTQVSQDQALRSFVGLDNGQTWLSTDGSLELIKGETVTIRHAAFGSFMLVSTQSKHSYHVRRVR